MFEGTGDIMRYDFILNERGKNVAVENGDKDLAEIINNVDKIICKLKV